MTEQQIQKKITTRYEKQGFFVLKLIKTTKNGIPDLIVMKGNEFFFVEVKTPIGRLSPIQEFRIKELKSFGIETKIERE